MRENWKEQVPTGFKFSVKARKGLRISSAEETESRTRYLLDTARNAGRSSWPVLFQLPPNNDRKTLPDGSRFSHACQTNPKRIRVSPSDVVR